MKKLFKILLWLVGIVVVLMLALPLWIGPVATTVANAIVPKKTGTAFNLGQFALNPYSGKLAVGDMQLFNPDGFDQKMAATLGALDVEVDVATLVGDPIVVKEVVLKDVFVSYVMNVRGENNFAIIKKNAAGGEEEVKVEGQGQERNGLPTSNPQPKTQSLQPSTFNPHPTTASARKFIIGHMLIQNVIVQLGPISMPMPNIELNDIGRKSDGVTMTEAWNQIYAQVMQNFNALGVNVNDLVNNLGSAGLEQALKAVGSAGDLRTKAGRNRAVKNLANAFFGGVEAAGNATGKTTDAVGDVTKKSVDVTGEATKNTVDAVSEQTDKAVNVIKGFFK